ncbi:MAG: hypothetical protein WDN75_09535 [Bacteroidota bacterium]
MKDRSICGIVLVVLLWMASTDITAQSLTSSNIAWKATSMRGPKGSFKTNPGSIVTYKMNTAELKDTNGTVLKSYTLTNPVGDLQDAGQSGRIRFTTKSADGEVGILQINKKGQVTQIALSFHSATAMPDDYYYEINSIEVL